MPKQPEPEKTESKPQAAKPSVEPKTPPKKTEQEVKEKPVVEVIPREEAKQPELTLEPLPVEKPSSTAKGEMPTPEQPQPLPTPEQVPEAPQTTSGQPPASGKASSPQPVTEPTVKEAHEKATTTGEPTKTKVVVEKASEKNTLTITAGVKTPDHPFYGKGHKTGFMVDGVSGKELVLERGKTYKFIVKTNPKHDVYISTKAIGWGSTAWTDGVTGMYTYKGTITFTPDENTPDMLYYSCRNHPYMGGKINIVDPGETVEIKRVARKPASAVPPGVDEDKISANQVNQKLMFADMLLSSKTAKQVAKSGMLDAISLQTQGKQMLEQAKAELKAGNNTKAYADADQALEMLKKSSSMVPSESELQQLKTHYEELLTSIKNFEKSHADNVKRITKAKGEKAVVDYDKEEVESLKAEGMRLAKKGDYVKANQSLGKAQHMITVALQQMLQSQTIVYDLKFDTPKDEYEYELKRFGGYEELIPVAIEAKKPTEGAIKLMKSYLEKSRKMRDEAKKKAGAGDYPVAIRMMQDATKTVRLALRMVGVMQ
jgi:HEPN domain-containing protein